MRKFTVPAAAASPRIDESDHQDGTVLTQCNHTTHVLPTFAH